MVTKDGEIITRGLRVFFPYNGRYFAPGDPRERNRIGSATVSGFGRRYLKLARWVDGRESASIIKRLPSEVYARRANVPRYADELAAAAVAPPPRSRSWVSRVNSGGSR